jgi:hypothetical protein
VYLVDGCVAKRILNPMPVIKTEVPMPATADPERESQNKISCRNAARACCQ